MFIFDYWMAAISVCAPSSRLLRLNQTVALLLPRQMPTMKVSYGKPATGLDRATHAVVDHRPTAPAGHVGRGSSAVALAASHRCRFLRLITITPGMAQAVDISSLLKSSL